MARIKVTSAVLMLLLLQGCNIGVKYYSSPPGALLHYKGATDTIFTKGEGSGYAPLEVFYAQTDAFKSGGCMTVDTPSAQWPNGAKLDSQRIEACKNRAPQSFMWQYTLVSPSPSMNQNIPAQPLVQDSIPPVKGLNLNDAKTKCNELGFKMGTEAFGNCVLKISK